jgi:hypothetical protein
MMALAVKIAEVAQVEVLVKYGTPPEVPATVSAKVPEEVIGDPATEIIPPVNDCATLVTVPAPAAAHEGTPAATVRTVPVPPTVNFDRVFEADA